MKIVRQMLSLLDMYSPDPIRRLCVLLCFSLGCFMLWRDLFGGSRSGSLPFLLLLWANHERFLQTITELLARRRWLVLAVPIAVFIGRLVLSPPTASDDLLRHIARAFSPEGYAGMYVHTALPPVDLYPAFDGAVGWIARLIGALPTMWLMQILAFGSFALVFIAAARRILGPVPMAEVIVLCALTVTLQIVAGRLMLARPEVFMTIWVLAAICANTRSTQVAWVFAGLVLSTGYWLAPIYYPAVFLVRATTRARLSAFFCMLLGWTAFWFWMSEGEILASISWLGESLSNRIPGLMASENISIANALITPPLLWMVIAAVWISWLQAGDPRLVWLSAYFVLSNQVRYGGVVAPLLALFILSSVRGREFPWPKLTRPIAVVLAAGSLSLLAEGLPRYEELPRFSVPDGARVLTGFNEATYSSLFVNPGRIRVAPAFEVGASDVAVQKLVLELLWGRLDCGEIARLEFSHLIEKSLRGPPPSCLQLERTQDGWRLWSVRPGQ